MQFHLKPTAAAPVHQTNLSAFVTADMRFDHAAIRAAAKVAYATKLDFIDRYDGAPRRRWQVSCARQAIRIVRRKASTQLTAAVTARMAGRALPYSADETERLQALRSSMSYAPVNAHGNADFKRASGEFAQINWDAQMRLRAMILAEARGEG